MRLSYRLMHADCRGARANSASRGMQRQRSDRRRAARSKAAPRFRCWSSAAESRRSGFSCPGSRAAPRRPPARLRPRPVPRWVNQPAVSVSRFLQSRAGTVSGRVGARSAGGGRGRRRRYRGRQERRDLRLMRRRGQHRRGLRDAVFRRHRDNRRGIFGMPPDRHAPARDGRPPQRSDRTRWAARAGSAARRPIGPLGEDLRRTAAMVYLAMTFDREAERLRARPISDSQYDRL